MNRSQVPTWAAAAIAFVLGAVCFSLITSAWAILVYGLLVFGVAAIYRITAKHAER